MLRIIDIAAVNVFTTSCLLNYTRELAWPLDQSVR